MKRTEGSAEVKLLECVNPVKNKWRIRWDVIVKEDGSANYMEAEFTNGKPSVDDIKRTVLDWYNEQTDQAIILASHIRVRLCGCPLKTSSTIRLLMTLPCKRKERRCQ